MFEKPEKLDDNFSCPRVETEWARLVRRHESRREANAERLSKWRSSPNFKFLASHDPRPDAPFNFEQWENDALLLASCAGRPGAAESLKIDGPIASLARLAKACRDGNAKALGAFSPETVLVFEGASHGAVECLLICAQKEEGSAKSMKMIEHGLAEALAQRLSGDLLRAPLSRFFSRIQACSDGLDICNEALSRRRALLLSLGRSWFSNKPFLSSLATQSARSFQAGTSAGRDSAIDPQGLLQISQLLIKHSPYNPEFFANALGAVLDHAKLARLSSLDVSHHWHHGQVFSRPFADSVENQFFRSFIFTTFSPALPSHKEAQILFAGVLHERGFRLSAREGFSIPNSEWSFRLAFERLAESRELAEAAPAPAKIHKTPSRL